MATTDTAAARRFGQQQNPDRSSLRLVLTPASVPRLRDRFVSYGDSSLELRLNMGFRPVAARFPHTHAHVAFSKRGLNAQDDATVSLKWSCSDLGLRNRSCGPFIPSTIDLPSLLPSLRPLLFLPSVI